MRSINFSKLTKLMVAAIFISFGLVFLQSVIAIGNDHVSHVVDNGEHDGTATYKINKQLSFWNYKNSKGTTMFHPSPTKVVDAVASMDDNCWPDGDGKMYIFSDSDAHYDIHGLGLICEEITDRDGDWIDVYLTYNTFTWGADISEKFNVKGEIRVNSDTFVNIDYSWTDMEDRPSTGGCDYQLIAHIPVSKFEKIIPPDRMRFIEAFRNGNVEINLTTLSCDSH